jgi:methyl-accepting chemotaxis protein
MATEPIDTVAVRLVADASDLLEQADAAVEAVVEKGEEAGREFAKSMATEMRVVGDAVITVMEETGASLKDAAAEIASQPLFSRFAAEDAERYAQAMMEFPELFSQMEGRAQEVAVAVGELDEALVDGGESIETVAEAATELSESQLERVMDEIATTANMLDVSFVDAAENLTGLAESAGVTEEQLMGIAAGMDETDDLTNQATRAIGAINEQLDFLGKFASPEAKKQIKELQDEFENLGTVTADDVERLEKMADELGEVAAEFVIAEEQVEKVVDAFREMGIEIPNALQRDKIRNYVRELVRLDDGMGNVQQEADNFTDGLIEQGRQSQSLRGFLSQLTGGFQVFGVNLGSVVGGLGAAASAVLFLKEVIGGAIQFIKESTQVALAFAEANRDLAAAIRVNTVAGSDNTRTFQEWEQTIDQVARSTREGLQVATEIVTIALRELGAGTELADDQIAELTVTGTKFLDIYGVQLPQGINQLTRFISSGLADEGLARLGLELGKVDQETKAWELNLGRNLDALTETQREAVRYALILEQMEERTQAVGESQDTFADTLDDLAEDSERASKTLGTFFVPIQVAFETVVVRIKQGFAGLVGFLVAGVAAWLAIIKGLFAGIGAAAEALFTAIEERSIDALRDVPNRFKEAFQTTVVDDFRRSIDLITGDMAQYSQAADDAAGATEGLGDAIEVTKEQIDAFVQAAQKFADGMDKIARKLQDRLTDIATTFRQRRAREEAELQRDLRDIDRDAAIDRIEAIREFQIAEIRLREDFQKDIRQLEERFILDLEDAVRDRDARRVLQLQRRFNLEKKSRTEDFNLRNKRLKEDFQFELQEIEFQRQRRRQERILEFQEEMADLAVQQQQREEQARLNAQRQERELLAQIKARLEMLAAAAEEELGIEREKLDMLLAALIDVYGEDGPWVQWHEAAVKTVATAAEGIAAQEQAIVDNLIRTEGAIRQHLIFLQQAAQAEAQTLGALAGFAAGTATGGGGGGGGGVFTPRQRGGSFFATGPATMRIGEGRPERVDVTPLSQATGRPSAGFGGGQQDRMQIDLNVEASEMLVVEVADQTMSELADVVVNVSERGSQGGRGA